MFDPFWTNEQAWPRDPSGYVFLARAFNKIGIAKFGQEWTGKEGAARLPELLPEKLFAEDNTSDVNARYWLSFDAEATKALEERQLRVVRAKSIYQAARARIASGGGGAKPKEPEETMDLTAREWARAKEINKAEHDRALPLWTRARSVQSVIIDACEQGKLLSFHRPTAGGEMAPIPLEWWNADDVARWRVSSCSIDPTDPFRTEGRPSKYHWIYMKADSLSAFINQQPHSDIQSAFSGHLSPYLRLMISVAEKLNVTPENQPKKEVVMLELRTAWAGSRPLSANLVETMATLLREPDSQLGRARKPVLKKKSAKG